MTTASELMKTSMWLGHIHAAAWVSVVRYLETEIPLAIDVKKDYFPLYDPGYLLDLWEKVPKEHEYDKGWNLVNLKAGIAEIEARSMLSECHLIAGSDLRQFLLIIRKTIVDLNIEDHLSMKLARALHQDVTLLLVDSSWREKVYQLMDVLYADGHASESQVLQIIEGHAPPAVVLPNILLDTSVERFGLN